MKHKCLLLLCFLSLTLQAQITNLSKLSKGKFYSSDVIKDKNNNIRGYFLLFKSDKVAKETYELEYVVLDENLTKVTDGKITEMQYESWLTKTERISVDVSLYDDKLLLELAEVIPETEGFKVAKPYQRYRVLNITTNEIGKPFMYNKDQMHLDPEFERKLTKANLANNTSEKISFYDGVGIVANSRNYYEMEGIKSKQLVHYDADFKEVWKFKYATIYDRKQKELRYLGSDNDVIVMFNHFHKPDKNETYLPEVSTLFIDARKGVLRNEFIFPEIDKFSYRVVDCVIADDKVYIMGNYAEGNKYGTIDDKDNIGLYKFTFDKSTGKLVDSAYFKWESLAGKLDIKKNGLVKQEGYLYTHDMMLKKDGSILAVTEAFINSPITTNNMYFLELNEKLEVKELFEVTKFRNKFGSTSAHSSQIKRYGLFDFIDYQNLGDDEYLFFLNDNDKNSKNRKNSTLYGIVSYVGGKFSRQTLNLKTETSTIRAYNSKKGYLMLIEYFDDINKPTEFRLEKINY